MSLVSHNSMWSAMSLVSPGDSCPICAPQSPWRAAEKAPSETSLCHQHPRHSPCQLLWGELILSQPKQHKLLTGLDGFYRSLNVYGAVSPRVWVPRSRYELQTDFIRLLWALTWNFLSAFCDTACAGEVKFRESRMFLLNCDKREVLVSCVLLRRGTKAHQWRRGSRWAVV